ncbi:hypothetical protein Rsub_09807 [Raphidocelis subcapitata]|uniref:Protein kinase domain-containing protein n=1 Tax=Raphidocelis subcapitata TaxID=307507 RepID=A0A2V0PGH7_9CHLO|nr:hypothetical protein Rsub_09807 [Raphidocelis subcapitata]|eukprot:GBF97010.1 hypothetical protein Rsub_09807 [Raphidocelis subcapitata]
MPPHMAYIKWPGLVRHFPPKTDVEWDPAEARCGPAPPGFPPSCFLAREPGGRVVLVDPHDAGEEELMWGGGRARWLLGQELLQRTCLCPLPGVVPLLSVRHPNSVGGVAYLVYGHKGGTLAAALPALARATPEARAAVAHAVLRGLAPTLESIHKGGYVYGGVTLANIIAQPLPTSHDDGQGPGIGTNFFSMRSAALPHAALVPLFAAGYLAPEALAAAAAADGADASNGDAEATWLAPVLTRRLDAFALGVCIAEVAAGARLDAAAGPEGWAAHPGYAAAPALLREAVAALCAAQPEERITPAAALVLAFGTTAPSPAAVAAAAAVLRAAVGDPAEPAPPAAASGALLAPLAVGGRPSHCSGPAAPGTPPVGAGRPAVGAVVARAKHLLWPAAGQPAASSSAAQGNGSGSAEGAPEVESAGDGPAGSGCGEGAAAGGGACAKGGAQAKRGLLRRGLHRCAKRGRELRAALASGFGGCFGCGQAVIEG